MAGYSKSLFRTLVAFMMLLWLCLPSFGASAPRTAATKSAKNDSDYMFVGPHDTQWKAFYVEYGFTPKQWTAKERQTFSSVLNTVRAAHPDFFAHAIASCRPLGLIRRHMTDSDNNDIRGRAVCMMTGVATIEIDDAFFFTSRDYQIHAVAHELGHLLDTASFLSTAKPFMKIAQPMIAKVQVAYGNRPYAPMDCETSAWGETLALRAGLPSLDAAENLAECFAECVSYYLVDGPKSVSPAVRAYMREYVLKQNPQIERARKLYVEAEVATDVGDYQRAFRALNELALAQPQMLDVHSSRARIWGFKRDFEMMEFEAKEELALLHHRAIPKYHFTYGRVEELLADAQERYGFERVAKRMTPSKSR
jgi:hypothetical protein